MIKTVRTIFAAAFVAMLPLTAVYLVTGCRSATTVTVGPSGQPQTNAVYELDPAAGIAIAGVAQLAVPLAVKEDPNAGPYLALVSQAFAGFANGGVTDPNVIQSALNNISVKELRDNSTAKNLVLTAFNAYKGLAASAVDNKVEAAKWGPFAQDVLRAIAEGITGGLAAAN